MDARGVVCAAVLAAACRSAPPARRAPSAGEPIVPLSTERSVPCPASYAEAQGVCGHHDGDCSYPEGRCGCDAVQRTRASICGHVHIGDHLWRCTPVGSLPPPIRIERSHRADATTALVSGDITNSRLGTPLVGVVLVLESAALPQSRTTMTDDDGNYSFDALPPGAYELQLYYADIARTERIAVGPGDQVTLREALALTPDEENAPSCIK